MFRRNRKEDAKNSKFQQHNVPLKVHECLPNSINGQVEDIEENEARSISSGFEKRHCAGNDHAEERKDFHEFRDCESETV